MVRGRWMGGVAALTGLMLAMACGDDGAGNGDEGDSTGVGPETTSGPVPTDDDGSGPGTSDPTTSDDTASNDTTSDDSTSGSTASGDTAAEDTDSGTTASNDSDETTAGSDGSSGGDSGTTGATANCPDDEVVLVGSYTIENSLDTEALAGYTEVTGDLTIAAPGLQDLDDLECLQRVGGNMEVWGTDVTTLSGLGSLSEVGGFLEIVGNAELQDLLGLSNLTTVGEGVPAGHFEIVGNTSLNDLSGLGSLETIGWSVLISGNSLTNLDGLGTIDVGGELRVQYNHELVDTAGAAGVVAQTVYFIHNLALPCDDAEATVVLMEANGFSGASLIGDNLDGCGFSL